MDDRRQGVEDRAMTGESPVVLDAARRLLAGGALDRESRLLLLLRLSERREVLTEDEGDRYWAELVKERKHLPTEYRDELRELEHALFPGEGPEEGGDEDHEPPHGFEAEVLADVRAARELAASDRDAAAALLRACDERVEARSWPFGKRRVARAIVWAWIDVDPDVAISRMKVLSDKDRPKAMLQLLRIGDVTRAQWEAVGAALEPDDTRDVVMQLLGALDADPFAQLIVEARGLHLPPELFDAVVRALVDASGKELGYRRVPVAALASFWKLARFQRDVPRPQVDAAYEQFLGIVPERLRKSKTPFFDLLATALLVVQVGGEAGLLDHQNADRLIGMLPHDAQLVGWACHAAASAEPDDVASAVRLVADRTQADQRALALTLARLVDRDLGAAAVAAADATGLDPALRSGARRTWLMRDAEAVRKTLGPSDFAGDPVGEFLTQPTPADRAAYLRRATANGTTSLPGPMWVVPGAQRPEGWKGRRWDAARRQMAPAQVSAEYVTRTPLYPELRPIPGDPVDAVVAASGFGAYDRQTLDRALLEALVAWGDEHPDEVAGVTAAMWGAIRPDDALIFAVDLSNALLDRCATVLAADPEVLVGEFLHWVDREWVHRTHTRTENRVETKVSLPAERLTGLGLIGAASVFPFSRARSDDVVLRVLANFPATPENVRRAAAIYSQGKSPLDVQLPLELEHHRDDAWRRGVIESWLPRTMPTPAIRTAEAT
jgi:hypothetical protein